MGAQRDVPIDRGEPAWPQILAQMGEPAVIRMIDNMPAFPDEVPADDWREVRISVAAGMITVRRQASAWSCIVWGSADELLLVARDHLCEIIARGTTGSPDLP
jgi:hypothetical protein